MVEGISLLDFLLSALYIIVILIIANLVKPKTNAAYAQYYMKYVGIKIVFAILFAVLYIYYFKGGDTFLYFRGGNYIIDQILYNPGNILNILFDDFDNLKNLKYSKDQFLLIYFRGGDILLTSKLIAPFNFITYNSYLTSSILFTSFTAIGVWKLYTTLCKIYPSLYKQFAIGILFFPTIAFWGSGILKDPITIMCVGLIFHSFYNISKGEKIMLSVLLVIVSSYLCLVLKPYILYLFIPSMLLWLQSRISTQIKSPTVRVLTVIFLSATFFLSGFFLINVISQSAGKYSLENVQQVAEGFQSWHTYLAETRNQSGYSLGEFEFTLTGILTKSPQAFFVTYYRPFLLTEATNFSLVFEGIQTMILLILTIYTILKVGFLNFFRLIISNPDVRVFMLFAVLFGITVGITSYNFGALARYKIPGLPFFTASLAIIYYLGFLKPKEQAKR